MLLKDNIDFKGVFSIKAYKADGTIEEYTDKNLIMDEARKNMAQLVGGVTIAGDSFGSRIDKFVLGTLGHVGTNILDYKKVGENSFDSTRTSLFSEVTTGALNYRIPFSVAGGLTVTDNNAIGTMFVKNVQGTADSVHNTVTRVVADRTVTYTITIPAECGNSGDPANSVIAYTEAALYAGGEIFSMKTYPARVKENSVKLIISWSIIF